MQPTVEDADDKLRHLGRIDPDSIDGIHEAPVNCEQDSEKRDHDRDDSAPYACLRSVDARELVVRGEQRIGVEELTTFINSIIQAEQLGVGIAQVLRVQSDQLRTKRRQRAEKSAHEAPIKMLFPLVLFIFPAFLLVILGPAAIRIAQSIG